MIDKIGGMLPLNDELLRFIKIIYTDYSALGQKVFCSSPYRGTVSHNFHVYVLIKYVWKFRNQ